MTNTQSPAPKIQGKSVVKNPEKPVVVPLPKPTSVVIEAIPTLLESKQSPRPKEVPEVLEANPIVQLDYYAALRMMVRGEKLTRLEWNDGQCVGWLDATRKHLIILIGGKEYSWVPNEGDILGIDWVVVN